MKFHVKGAHRESGEDVEMILEAADAEKAAALLNSLNLMVEKIDPATAADLVLPEQHEYHTLRCNFSDLTNHLNEYGQEDWRVINVHHDPREDHMVRVVMERPRRHR